jgi:CRISPR type III-A-associated protein Csm2
MTEIIKEEQPSIWSFFCKNEDEQLAMTSGSIEEAVSNILEINNSDYLISRTDNLVQKRLANAITTSQLRKLFEKIKDLDNEKVLSTKLTEVRIQLIYIAARQNNPVAKEFVQFIKELITRIGNDETKLKRFQLFMESIVSYHTYYSKR